MIYFWTHVAGADANYPRALQATWAEQDWLWHANNLRPYINRKGMASICMYHRPHWVGREPIVCTASSNKLMRLP